MIRVRPIACALAALFAVQGQVLAAERPARVDNDVEWWASALQDEDVKAAVGGWVIETGVGARIVGQCEAKFPPGAFDRYVASLAKISGDSTSNYVSVRVRDLILKNYAEGRTDRSVADLSAKSCAELIDEHLRLQRSAAAKAERVLAAYRRTH